MTNNTIKFSLSLHIALLALLLNALIFTVFAYFTYPQTNILSASIFALVLASLMSLLLFITCKRLLAPINAINHALIEYQENHIVTFINIEKNNELGSLANNIQSLLDQLYLHESNVHIDKAQIQAILDTAADAIISIDEDGLISAFNRAAEVMFDYHENEVLGRNINILMPEPYHLQHDQFIRHYQATGERNIIGSTREIEAKRRDGSIFPMELSVSEVNTPDGNIYTGFIRDITKKKQQEQDLLQAKEKAEQVSRLKSEFLANVSHEIRTPMNGIIGMSNLLLSSVTNKEQKSQLKIVLHSAESLLDLINDVLDFSKIEAGKLSFESTNFDLQTLIEETLEVIAVKAQEKKLELLLRYPKNFVKHVSADPSRIRQVLLNLLSNAVKFTETGHVLLDVQVLNETADSIKYRFIIQDTGIGIAADKLETIFNEFDQADNSTTRRFGGTGLGLSISKKLTELMGGDIAVCSTPNQGSTFTFTINFTKNQHVPTNLVVEDMDNLKGKSVLLLDDNWLSQQITTEQLWEAQLKVTQVSTYAEALSAISMAQQQNQAFDILISDDKLPDGEALNLLQDIKAQRGLLPEVCMLYASDQIDNYAAILPQAGFHIYLNKPGKFREINLALATAYKNKTIGHNELITRYSLCDDESTISPECYFDNAQILLVEDNKVNLLVATTLLEECGCLVTPAGNGLEGLEQAKTQSFNLILMDCLMPEMDGFTATQNIRVYEQQQQQSATPIVALTANALVGDREKCLAAGMDDYLSKPLRKADLIACLRKWLNS